MHTVNENSRLKRRNFETAVKPYHHLREPSDQPTFIAIIFTADFSCQLNEDPGEIGAK